MGRRDRFKEKKAQREKAIAEKSGYGPQIEYMPMVKDEYRILRMLGDYPEGDNHKPTDWTYVKSSMFKDDKGKFMSIIWKTGKNPFADLFYYMTAGKWDKDANNGKGEKIYEKDGCDLLKRILTDNSDNPYASGWKPSIRVLGNVIDRHDDWCKTNKHTKCIAKSMTEKDGKVYYTQGITKAMFNLVWDDLCTEYGLLYDEFDVAIRTLSKKIGDNTWYKVKNAGDSEAILKAAGAKDGVDYLPLVSSEPLTEEELSYEMYDLSDIPFVSTPTPMKFVFERLKKFVKAVDAKYDTDFYTAFEEAIAEETEEYKQKKAEDAEGKPVQTSLTEKKETLEKVTEETEDLPEGDYEEEKPKVRKVRKVKVEPKKEVFSVDSLDPEEYKGLPNLSDEEKSLIIGQSNDGTLLFSVDEDEMGSCSTCKADFPDDHDTCVYCGQQFD